MKEGLKKVSGYVWVGSDVYERRDRKMFDEFSGMRVFDVSVMERLFPTLSVMVDLEGG